MLPTINLGESNQKAGIAVESEDDFPIHVPSFDVNNLTPEQRDYIQKQTLANDAIFKAVMSDANVMKPVIQEFLKIRVESIEFIRVEDYRKAAPVDSSAVKFDVVCRLEDGRTVNVEVQNAKTPQLLRRARFYSSILDAFFADTNHGANYAIPDSFVLFFCSNDSFPFSGSVAYGSTQYTVYQNGRELPCSSSDGRHIVFVNFDRLASKCEQAMGEEATRFCKLFGPEHKPQQFNGSVFGYAWQRLSMFKESAIGMSEILKEEYEREHIKAMFEEGRAEGEVTRAASCLSVFMSSNYSREEAIETTRKLMGDMDKDLFNKAVHKVFG